MNLGVLKNSTAYFLKKMLAKIKKKLYYITNTQKKIWQLFLDGQKAIVHF